MQRNGQKPLTARSCYGHLGGRLGNLLFERMLELGWLKKCEGKSTVYEIIETGRSELFRLGIDTDRGEKIADTGRAKSSKTP